LVRITFAVDQYIGESEVFILFPLLIFILFSAIRSVSVFRFFSNLLFLLDQKVKQKIKSRRSSVFRGATSLNSQTHY
jgi:hypothetical protein